MFRFPTVEKFFCLIPLEIGIHILGFWVILSNVLSLAWITALWIISRNPRMIDDITRQFPDFEKLFRAIPDYMLQIWYLLFAIFWCLFYIWAAAKLIRSRISRNHKDVLPYLVLTLIELILVITTIFTAQLQLPFVCVFSTIFLVIAFKLYIYICVFSMYKRLENENFGRERLLDDGYGNQTQYQSISA